MCLCACVCVCVCACVCKTHIYTDRMGWGWEGKGVGVYVPGWHTNPPPPGFSGRKHLGNESPQPVSPPPLPVSGLNPSVPRGPGGGGKKKHISAHLKMIGDAVQKTRAGGT